MHHLIDAVKLSVDQKNWYAALSLALTLPDICGRLEGRIKGSQKRYADWFDRFVSSRYRGGPFYSMQFLGGDDCYALRCAFLHQGEFDTVDQHAAAALEGFEITAPIPGALVHNNRINSRLQVQADIFCLDIASGAEAWLKSVAQDAVIQASIAKLASVSGVIPKPA